MGPLLRVLGAATSGQEMVRGGRAGANRGPASVASAVACVAAASIAVIGCGGGAASRPVHATTGQVSAAAATSPAKPPSPSAVARRRSPRGRLSNRPGAVSQAEIKTYPYTLIRALSTERYAVTRELSGSLGKGDCGVTVVGPARELPVVAFGGVPCPTAVRVIGLWSINEGRRDESGLCYQDLCTHLFPRYLGFFCRTTLDGDSSWTTTCRRGARKIVTSAAD